MKCPQCNTSIADGSKFCPVCGIAVEEKKCRKCASPIPQDAKFCPNCGAEQVAASVCASCNAPLEEGAKFCAACGAPTEAPKAPQSPEENKYAAQVLTFGILGLAFALSFWLSVLGIVFSAITRGKLKTYLKHSESIKDARAAVGNGLSIAGLAVGIVFTVLLIITVIAFFSIPALPFDSLFDFILDDLLI